MSEVIPILTGGILEQLIEETVNIFYRTSPTTEPATPHIIGEIYLNDVIGIGTAALMTAMGIVGKRPWLTLLGAGGLAAGIGQEIGEIYWHAIPYPTASAGFQRPTGFRRRLATVGFR
jgi:hypothetical protein